MKSICDKFAFITLFYAILCFQWSIQDKIRVHIPNLAVQALRDQAVICEKETGIPAVTLKKIIDWPMATDKATKEFLYCVSYNGGYVDKEGHFNLENMSKLQVQDGTLEEFLNNIKECNKMKLENHLETTYAMGECVHKYNVFTVSD